VRLSLTAIWRGVGVVDKDAVAGLFRQNVGPVDGVNVAQMWIVADKHVTIYYLCIINATSASVPNQIRLY